LDGLIRHAKSISIACAIFFVFILSHGIVMAGEAPAASAPAGPGGPGEPRPAAGSSWVSRLHGGGHFANLLAMDAQWEIESKDLAPFYGNRIDTILITGNTHTKPATILREMATKQGQPLEEKLIRRDASYLRGLGYFSDVRVSAEEAGGDECKLVVAITERPGLFMKYPYPVVNYDFNQGVSYGLTWRIKNFRGEGDDISITGLNRPKRDRAAGFTFRDPWFMGKRIQLRLDFLGYQRREIPAVDDFIKDQTLGCITLGIPLTRSLVHQLWFRPSVAFERRNSRLTRSIPGLGVTSDFHFQDFLSVGAALEYDSRNNRISPFEGMLHQFRVTRFSSVSGVDSKYIFYSSNDMFYIPVGTNRSFILSFNGNVREGDLPTFFEMGLAGTRDLRGLTKNDLRGTARIISTIQYRQQILGPLLLPIPKVGKFDITLNGIAFVDNGALSRSILDFPQSTFYTTGGVGIEIISPLRDLMRIEVATDGSGSPAFYVTAGSNY
jgi:outer membrane protein assembly factor BamA